VLLNAFDRLDQQQALQEMAMVGPKLLEVPGESQLQPVHAIIHEQPQVLKASPGIGQAAFQEMKAFFPVIEPVTDGFEHLAASLHQFSLQTIQTRYDPFGGRGRGRGTKSRDQIGDGEVNLVAYG